MYKTINNRNILGRKFCRVVRFQIKLVPAVEHDEQERKKHGIARAEIAEGQTIRKA